MACLLSIGVTFFLFWALLLLTTDDDVKPHPELERGVLLLWGYPFMLEGRTSERKPHKARKARASHRRSLKHKQKPKVKRKNEWL